MARGFGLDWIVSTQFIPYSAPYLYLGAYLHQCYVLYVEWITFIFPGHWNINVMLSMWYQCDVMHTNVMLSAPTSVEQPILPPLARLSLHGVTALFAIVLTLVTLTPNGAKTENFGELERIIISVSKWNNGHQTSLKRWNNRNPVEIRHSEKKVKNETP